MRRFLNQLRVADSGSSAAEFAFVLPLLLVFIFGIIDVGRAMWMINEAAKATQAGARFAVATDLVPTGLNTYDFAVDGGLTQGATIPENQFGGIECTSAGCQCKSGATCPASTYGTFSTAAFNRIVARMHAIMPDVTAANVRVDYAYSGIGFAGDPNAADVAPLVRVSLRNLRFQPITFLLFNGSINIPASSTALPLEDGRGTVSN